MDRLLSNQTAAAPQTETYGRISSDNYNISCVR